MPDSDILRREAEENMNTVDSEAFQLNKDLNCKKELCFVFMFLVYCAKTKFGKAGKSVSQQIQ